MAVPLVFARHDASASNKRLGQQVKHGGIQGAIEVSGDGQQALHRLAEFLKCKVVHSCMIVPKRTHMHVHMHAQARLNMRHPDSQLS